jgi:hypothetical protein
VVCGSRGIYVIHNPRGGNSGLDADTTLRVLNANRGCISPYSIVKGDGWVGYLTKDGYVVTDGDSEIIISRDHWNVSSGEGDWAYELATSRTAADSDTDDHRFYAMVSGGKLFVTMRVESDSYPTRMFQYDFSPGLAASGLAEVTMGSSEAYGWSSALTGATSSRFYPMAMADVAGVKYALLSNNDGSTNDGGVLKFDITSGAARYKDDGLIPSYVVRLRADRFDSMLKKSLMSARCVYTMGKGSAGGYIAIGTGLVTPTKVLSPATATALSSTALLRADLPTGVRGPLDAAQFFFQWIDVSDINDFRLFMAELDYELLPTYP